ncbi:Guanine nucleotide-binding protein subunit gamma 3 like [Actinidia chinensis var. chinensis]|uniref:Guanine nucleotide-binding protein subunit gamma 3 like n=1 Tax=Actinidia chinensis var. chinensis TaxID=1590841 RepID=A0A2R6R453_ACTCC|nr:Guanine nucleotide-binding protein subunit gamma 3 like [Actinidia chinensis var. chinensis]
MAAASPPPSLLPQRRKSPPPAYPDLYGKRREMAKVQMLEREIGFLEEEVKYVQGLQPASLTCKEVADFVVANSDPLMPVDRKIRRSRRIWKSLCGASCFNFTWICCFGCTPRLKIPYCCFCNLRNCPSCFRCPIPKYQCCPCPRLRCLDKISCGSQKCCVSRCPSCPNCPCPCPCRWKCYIPKCPKVSLCCCSCTKNCCCSCCLCYCCS